MPTTLTSTLSNSQNGFKCVVSRDYRLRRGTGLYRNYFIFLSRPRRVTVGVERSCESDERLSRQTPSPLAKLVGTPFFENLPVCTNDINGRRPGSGRTSQSVKILDLLSLPFWDDKKGEDETDIHWTSGHDVCSTSTCSDESPNSPCKVDRRRSVALCL